MKHVLLSLFVAATAAHAAPKVQVTAELTGAAESEALSFAAAQGEGYPFPLTVTTKQGTRCGVELGWLNWYPTTTDGKFESRHVGVILTIEPKLVGDRITYTGSFQAIRPGATTKVADAGAVATVFRSWECSFSGTAQPGKQVTIDLAEQASSPAALKLTFTPAEEAN